MSAVGVVSVHIADVRAADAAKLLARGAPRDGVDGVGGLRHADLGLASPLAAGPRRPPMLRRIALFGFWDDADAVDAFATEHPVAEILSGGWRVTLEPLRRFGSWPGLSPDIPTGRHTDYSGPSVVITLGRLRLPQAPRFLRTSRAAEKSAVANPALVWGAAIVRPPFVATCSVWRDTASLATYAYGRSNPGHLHAIDAGEAKPFHHEQAFVRFRAVESEGRLGGRYPFDPSILA